MSTPSNVDGAAQAAAQARPCSNAPSRDPADRGQQTKFTMTYNLIPRLSRAARVAWTVREYRARCSPRKEHDPLPSLLSPHHVTPPAYVPLPLHACARSTPSKQSTRGSTQGHVTSPQPRSRGTDRHTRRLTSHDGGTRALRPTTSLNQGPLSHLPGRGGMKKAPKVTAQSTAGGRGRRPGSGQPISRRRQAGSEGGVVLTL